MRPTDTNKVVDLPVDIAGPGGSMPVHQEGSLKNLGWRVFRGVERGLRDLTQEVSREVQRLTPLDKGRSRMARSWRLTPGPPRGIVATMPSTSVRRHRRTPNPIQRLEIQCGQKRLGAFERPHQGHNGVLGPYQPPRHPGQVFNLYSVDVFHQLVHRAHFVSQEFLYPN